MAERLRERPANLDILGSIPGPGLHSPFISLRGPKAGNHFAGRVRSCGDKATMKTVYICIGLVIGFVIGLIGASFVVDMMSR